MIAIESSSLRAGPLTHPQKPRSEAVSVNDTNEVIYDMLEADEFTGIAIMGGSHSVFGRWETVAKYSTPLRSQKNANGDA